MSARPETQQDRCSDQAHLWRQRTAWGFTHMACRCGAVHPADLDAFFDAYLDANHSSTRRRPVPSGEAEGEAQ